LSRLRQFLLARPAVAARGELLAALSRVVDLAVAIHATAQSLHTTLERLRASAAQGGTRVRSTCETVIAPRDHGALQAYLDHFAWKLEAFSLDFGLAEDALEEPPGQGECALGRWLARGGAEAIPEPDRTALLDAHDRLHRLMLQALGYARDHRSEAAVRALAELEDASERIAATLAKGIERELHALAALDRLTGLGNRRLFEHELQRRVAQALRGNLPFGLLFMDLDRFKAINDRYGHRVGDEALAATARNLTAVLRGSDAVFRWGGEEFAALVGAGSFNELWLAAERVRAGIESTPVRTASATLALTLSVGAAYYRPDEGIKPWQLFGRADDNLNKAKAAGRNRVVMS
jgi:diguanylate cyclase (GGDEF)-like protein